VAGGGSGSGTVTGNGLNCTLTAGTPSGTCTATLDQGTAVSLTATATAGEFTGWSDVSCGTTSPCAFTMTAAKSLSATFEPPTLTVTTNADSGAGSLRAAVDQANTTPGADTITIAVGLSAITLTSGQLDITGALTIAGPAAGQTIDGNQNGRIFGVTAANANLTLENLTLTNARTTAGRIANDCSSSSGQGGAVCALGELTLTNSTVADNTAAATGGGVYGHDTVSLTSSILAGNTTGGSPDDCGMSSGSATASTSLIQATGACGVTEGQNGNLIGQDPLLAALADNGCATPSAGDGTCVLTHALTTGSPAIDAGSNPNHLTTDQRGRPRVQDAAVDMGAFESTQLGLTVTGGGKGEGTVTGNGLSCTLTAGTPSGLCTATLVEGSAVSATAAATTGSSFSGWTDATCQGTTNPCSFNLSAATTLTAAFGKSQYDLTVTGGGSGSGTV